MSIGHNGHKAHYSVVVWFSVSSFWLWYIYITKGPPFFIQDSEYLPQKTSRRMTSCCSLWDRKLTWQRPRKEKERAQGVIWYITSKMEIHIGKLLTGKAFLLTWVQGSWKCKKVYTINCTQSMQYILKTKSNFSVFDTE